MLFEIYINKEDIMKKLFYMAGFVLAATFTSCDDFLTVSSPDQLTTGNFWRDVEDVEATMASVYAQLYHGDEYATSEVRWPVEEYRADLFNLGNDAINYQTWTDIYNFTYTNGNTQFSYYYQDLYRGINFANQIIEYCPKVPAEKISETKRNELMAEAHFMRGYYHLMLLLNWEKIIIRDQYVNDEGLLEKPLSSRTACWDFVIEELKAGTAMPSQRDTQTLGRATKGTANAYLGFAYLTRAYEEPAKESEYLTASLNALNAVQGYSLVSGEALVDMFNGHNKNCAESLFEVQYSMNMDGGAFYASCVQWWMAPAELEGWDEILPNDKLVAEFMKEGKTSLSGGYDERMYNTLFFQDEYWNSGEHLIYGSWIYDDVFKDKNGVAYNRPAFRKFTAKTYDEAYNDYCDFNIPLMRYANVMLMKAEVLNKQGHPEQAIPLINEIRKVHGNMPPMAGTTQAEVQAQIEHERILEFPLESYRFYDLRRWGKLAEALQGRGYVAGQHDFFPIPLWEVNANRNLNNEAEAE